MFTTFLGLLISFTLILIIVHFKRSFTYWSTRSVPYISPTFPFGNMGSVFLRRQNMNDKLKEIYDLMKRKSCKYVGLYFFSRPALLVIDPDLVKNILTKDFQFFHDRGIHYDEVNDPLSAHLFSLSGLKWKSLRTKFTPAFTPGKVKYMFQTFLDCGTRMVTILSDMKVKGQEVEIKDIMARFTTDVIGSCAFGIECNSMKSPNTEFREMGKRAFTQTVGDLIRVTIIRSFPRLAKLLGLGIFSSTVTKFFKSVVKETIEYREANNVIRKDFLQLLIQLKRNGQVDGADSVKQGLLTMDEAAAQAFIFFLAGFETTATTISFALYEMSINQNIQESARLEVTQILNKHKDKLTYKAIMELRYLDAVIAETLRKYPPAPIYLRVCTKDYRVENTNLLIEKGLSVLIPASALQRDPEYFSNPDQFDPERFNESNKSQIGDYIYIPFGDGPRNCIGQRFAMAQIKVGLTLILKNFRFSLLPKTKRPLEMEKKGIITTPAGGIWLNFEKLVEMDPHPE